MEHNVTKKPLAAIDGSTQVLSEAKQFEVEMLEKEILYFKGNKREKAMKAYRELVRSLGDEPIYLKRVE
jgi:hypothetical protein